LGLATGWNGWGDDMGGGAWGDRGSKKEKANKSGSQKPGKNTNNTQKKTEKVFLAGPGKSLSTSDKR